MRVPVWITEIQWLSDDTTMRLVTGTGHHQVRVYDTVKQRRPTLDVSVGDHPIKTIGVNASKSEFVLADTTSNMTSIDAKTGKVTGRFSGIAGAVTQTVYCTSHDYVISVGVDRKLRLFEGSGRHRMVKEIYLKQRLTALLVDEDWTPESDEAAHAAAAAGASESEIAAAAAATGKADDEDLWENMAQADDEEDEAEAKPAKAIRKKRKQPSV
ncbi:hypothetical protein BC831DRAFT_131309 [Entophlyctis helioformis]|nr:hypothetical protein BC831DRAFT_131309 [Entophlyctis helioformis]